MWFHKIAPGWRNDDMMTLTKMPALVDLDKPDDWQQIDENWSTQIWAITLPRKWWKNKNEQLSALPIYQNITRKREMEFSNPTLQVKYEHDLGI